MAFARRKPAFRRRPRTIRRRKFTRRAPRKTHRPSTLTLRTAKNPFPKIVNLKLPYSENIELATSTGNGVYQWRNSLFDPNNTGVGHQPFGRDQWSAFYTHYIVWGIKYKLTLINTSAGDQITYTLNFKDHTGASANMQLAREKDIIRSGVLGAAGSGRNIQVLRGYMDSARVQSITKKQMWNEKAHQIDVGQSPSADESSYLTIESQAADSSTSVTLRVIAELVYYATYFDPVTIGSS